MATPTITAIYPNNGQTSVPIGADITVTFSSGIDLSTAKKNVVLYGPDFDMLSGPETATWLQKDGTNLKFLDSPGFKGIVECNYELIYVDSNGDEVELSPTSESDETGGPYTHKLKISPKTILAPNVEYNLYIIGEDEEGTERGVSARTVYEVDDTNAPSTTASVHVYGGYKGDSTDTITIKITSAGNIGTAEYKWWYSDTEPETSARTGKVTSRRFRKLEDGVQVRFSGSGFVLGEYYTVALNPPQLMETSYTFSFTTSTTEITKVPSSASTTVIGTTATTTSSFLEVMSIDPEDGATHQKFASKQITIEFSAALDSDTVTDESVTVLAYPISGIIESAEDEVNLFKKLTVSGKKLIIDL